MAKGFGGMGGMNMNALMKQAQKMQKQMEEAQGSSCRAGNRNDFRAAEPLR